MRTIAANVNNNISGVALNDIYLDKDGNIALSFDLQAVLEACSQAAQTLLGEMLYNTNQGIPYYQTVWVGVPNVQQFNAALRTAFLAVPNVIEVISLITSQGPSSPSVPGEADQLSYTAVIRTIYGIGDISG